MKSRIFLPLVMIAFASGALAQCPNAGPPPSDAPCPNGGSCPAQKNEITTFKGGSSKLPKVTSIGEGVLMVGDKWCQIDSAAKITLDGKPATAAEIKVGMRALVGGKWIPGKIFRVNRITARTVKAE